jgi:hypothetical protein
LVQLAWGLILIALLAGLRAPSGRRAAALLAAPILAILAQGPDGAPAGFISAFAAPLIIGGSLSLALAIGKHARDSAPKAGGIKPGGN